jgi:hypothetical protein
MEIKIYNLKILVILVRKQNKKNEYHQLYRHKTYTCGLSVE